MLPQTFTGAHILALCVLKSAETEAAVLHQGPLDIPRLTVRFCWLRGRHLSHKNLAKQGNNNVEFDTYCKAMRKASPPASLHLRLAGQGLGDSHSKDLRCTQDTEIDGSCTTVWRLHTMAFQGRDSSDRGRDQSLRAHGQGRTHKLDLETCLWCLRACVLMVSVCMCSDGQASIVPVS